MRQQLGFYLAAVVIFTVAAIGLHSSTELEPLIVLATSLNISTFILFGYDKGAARADSFRVPESLLLTLALIGGSPAILLGMLMFRHKTRDRSFLPVLTVIFVVHLLLLKFFVAS